MRRGRFEMWCVYTIQGADDVDETPNAFPVTCASERPTLGEVAASFARARPAGDRGERWHWRVRVADGAFGYCWLDVLDPEARLEGVPVGASAFAVHCRIMDTSPRGTAVRAACARARAKQPRNNGPSSGGMMAPPSAPPPGSAPSAPHSKNAAPTQDDSFYDFDGSMGDASPGPRAPRPGPSFDEPEQPTFVDTSGRAPTFGDASPGSAFLDATPAPRRVATPASTFADDGFEDAGIDGLDDDDDVDDDLIEPPQPAFASSSSSASKPFSATNGFPGAVDTGPPLSPEAERARVERAVAERRASLHKTISDNQAQKKEEIRARQEAQAVEEQEFARLRVSLGPGLKAWSEDHGKKKNIRALLAGMDKVMWPEANWKAISIADLLEPGKVKRAYYKASRFCHPDKLVGLSCEQRFIGQTVFDALSQAYAEFENSGQS